MAKTTFDEKTKKSFELREEEYIAELEDLFDDEDPGMFDIVDEEERKAKIAEYNAMLTRETFKDADENDISFDEDDVCEEIKESLPTEYAGLGWPTDVDKNKCPRIGYEKYCEYFEELKKAIEEVGRYNNEEDELLIKIYAGIMRPIVKNCYYKSGYNKLCNSLNDAYQDGYVKLMNVLGNGAYFINVPENFVKHPKGFLGWAKKVIWRNFRSQVKRKGLGELATSTSSLYEPITTKSGEVMERQIEDKDNPSPLDRLEKVERQSVFFNFIALRRYSMNRKLAAFMIFSACYNYFNEAEGQTRDRATDDIVAMYADIPLDELFDIFVIKFLNAPGSDLAIHPMGINKMRVQLNSYNPEGRRYGDTCISDYFGNGNKSPESVISDWLSKMLADYRNELSKYINR